MTGPTDDELKRQQLEAATRTAIANARTAEAAAAKAEFDNASAVDAGLQAKFKSLIPDVSGTNIGVVDDKSTDVAFSGLMTYVAVANAAATIGQRLRDQLGDERSETTKILVTTNPDLLSANALYHGLKRLIADADSFVDKVLAIESTATREQTPTGQIPGLQVMHFDVSLAAPALATALGAVTGGAAPVALAAGSAVAAAIPGLLSLFSSTSTIKSGVQQISDTAAASAVAGELCHLDNLEVNLEDFRLMPTITANDAPTLAQSYDDLLSKRGTLLESKVASAEPADHDQPINALVDAAVASIDAVTLAVTGTGSTGGKSPMTIALLSEAIERKAIDYVLLVTSLGGQSQEVLTDRHIRSDTYSVLVDATINYQLFDVESRTMVSAGIVSGLGSAHGTVGNMPTIRLAPTDIQQLAAQPASGAVATPPGQPVLTDAAPAQHVHHLRPPHLPWKHGPNA